MSNLEPLTVFVVDDENLARERLKRMIEKTDRYQVCGEAENGQEAIRLITEQKPDIVLLDIRMPGMDGLEVANHLTRMRPAPAIIFCTAYDEYAIKAFQHHAVGYLLKPARTEELEHALGSCQRLSQAQLKELASQDSEQTRQSFVANSWQGHELIPLDHIYYFRADNKYLTVVHTQGETLSDQTLKDLEQQYEHRFIRTHRNSLVNTLHIQKLLKDAEGHYQVVLSDGAKVPVSRRHVSEVKQRILQ